MRFDCDLSLEIDDQEMKTHSNIWHYKPSDYYKLGLSKKQQQRIEAQNKAVKEK